MMFILFLDDIHSYVETLTINKKRLLYRAHHSPTNLPYRSLFTIVHRTLQNVSPSLGLTVPCLLLLELTVQAHCVPATDQAPNYCETATNNDETSAVLVTRLLRSKLRGLVNLEQQFTGIHLRRSMAKTNARRTRCSW